MLASMLVGTLTRLSHAMTVHFDVINRIVQEHNDCR